MAAGERVLSVSTVFATTSLLVSLVTLYFSNLAPPSIAIVAGPNIKVYYPSDGGLGLYLPIAFVNSSAATGSITRRDGFRRCIPGLGRQQLYDGSDSECRRRFDRAMIVSASGRIPNSARTAESTSSARA